MPHERQALLLSNDARHRAIINDLISEIERLREGIRKLETVHRQRNEQRDLTAAENERMREVLRLFTQPCDCLNVCQQEPSNAGPRHCPRIIARAALEGKE